MGLDGLWAGEELIKLWKWSGKQSVFLSYFQIAQYGVCREKWKWSWKTSYDAVWENLGRRTCCSAVTTRCWFQCGVAEVCVLPRALLLSLH